MPKTLEFYFDVGTPTTYLAYKALPAVLERTGAGVDYIPFLVGAVMKATGNSPPMTVPAKGRYMLMDMQRAAKRIGCAFRMNPNFPVNTLAVQRGAVVAKAEGRLIAYLDAMFDAMWAEARDLGDPGVVAAVLTDAGFDPAHIAARIEEPGIKETLKADTERAVERGAFGAPTFFVGDEMFWGHDRLDHVEEALAG